MALGLNCSLTLHQDLCMTGNVGILLYTCIFDRLLQYSTVLQCRSLPGRSIYLVQLRIV